MFSFDVAKDWVILSPPLPAAEKAAAEIAHYIALLRKQAGLVQAVPVRNALDPAPEYVPLILLNAEGENRLDTGFSWRAGYDRIELYGKSGRGLCNGAFSFLAALGVGWPEPERERLPPPSRAHPYLYDLKITRANSPSPGTAIQDRIRRRRIIFSGGSRGDSLKKGLSRLVWAARNKIDAAVFPAAAGPSLQDHKHARLRDALLAAAEQYALIIEIGGWDLSALVPRRLFPAHKDLFRMDSGKWKRDHHFCATNPKTMEVLKKEAAELFRSHPGTDVFHLWPDRNHERTWCSCPACRAFTAAEQNRIAVNAAADVLAALRPGAVISYYETPGEEGTIPVRPNMFRFSRRCGEPGPDADGVFWTE
jgi:hypothetical protein